MNTAQHNAPVERQASKARLFILGATLLAFSGFSLWVMLDVGYFGIWEAGFVSGGSLQILLDLVIACVVITSWMIADAKSRDVNPVPWVIAVMTTGTIAILAYLLVREMSFAGKGRSTQNTLQTS